MWSTIPNRWFTIMQQTNSTIQLFAVLCQVIKMANFKILSNFPILYIYWTHIKFENWKRNFWRHRFWWSELFYICPFTKKTRQRGILSTRIDIGTINTLVAEYSWECDFYQITHPNLTTWRWFFRYCSQTKKFKVTLIPKNLGD